MDDKELMLIATIIVSSVTLLILVIHTLITIYYAHSTYITICDNDNTRELLALNNRIISDLKDMNTKILETKIELKNMKITRMKRIKKK